MLSLDQQVGGSHPKPSALDPRPFATAAKKQGLAHQMLAVGEERVDAVERKLTV